MFFNSGLTTLTFATSEPSYNEYRQVIPRFLKKLAVRFMMRFDTLNYPK
jgi:hypothetical protein